MTALRLVAGAGNIWVVKTLHGVVCDSPKKPRSSSLTYECKVHFLGGHARKYTPTPHHKKTRTPTLLLFTSPPPIHKTLLHVPPTTRRG